MRIFARKAPDGRIEGGIRLFRHQVEALRAARAKRPYVLTTGTGSGKSLSYILPIVDDVLRRPERNHVKAIVVYPMNALANSQRGELEKYLKYGYAEAPVKRPPSVAPLLGLLTSIASAREGALEVMPPLSSAAAPARDALPATDPAPSPRDSATHRLDEPLLLTVDETAALLRTTRKAVYALIERAQLAGVVRLGRRVLVRRDELLRSLSEKRTASPGRTRR